jgi:hypothetical protein
MIIKKLSNTSKFLMVGVFVISVIFTLLYNYLFASSCNCQEAKDFIKDNYSGRVQTKFYNPKNHGVVTIIKNGKPRELVIPNDTLFFSFIKIGDSLVKNQNQDFIEVHRSNTITNFKINFGCKTETKSR